LLLLLLLFPPYPPVIVDVAYFFELALLSFFVLGSEKPIFLVSAPVKIVELITVSLPDNCDCELSVTTLVEFMTDSTCFVFSYIFLGSTFFLASSTEGDYFVEFT
jgi:hypothetical protein